MAVSSVETLRMASDILIAALEAKSITLLPDPKSRVSTPEHDAAQISRAFMAIHEAVLWEANKK